MTSSSVPSVSEPSQVNAHNRLMHLNRRKSVLDIYDALIEIITNSDDSYRRAWKSSMLDSPNGTIFIEYDGGRKGRAVKGGSTRRLTIRDRGTGMTFDEIKSMLSFKGEYQSSAGSRGYMGCGIKDCADIGKIIIESIKYGEYHRAVMEWKEDALVFYFEETGVEIDAVKREELHIAEGNGVSVTLELDKDILLPQFDNLMNDLSWHYALRDMLKPEQKNNKKKGKEFNTTVLIKKVGDKGYKKLQYMQPSGEKVCEIKFPVPKYGASASLVVYKSPDQLENTCTASRKERFVKAGMIIKSGHSIHECSLLDDSLRTDPHAQKFFGVLECQEIQKLVEDYGKDEKSSNPMQIINASRQGGLHREHPFTSALLKKPIEELNKLVEKERKKAKEDTSETRSTKEMFSRVARVVKKLINSDAAPSKGDDDAPAGDWDLPSNSMKIIPETDEIRIGAGKERPILVYANADLFEGTGRSKSATLKMSMDRESLKKTVATSQMSRFIKMRTGEAEFKQLTNAKNIYRASFKVEGIRPSNPNDTIILEVVGDGLPECIKFAKVIADEHSFQSGSVINFENDSYAVREGGFRDIKIRANNVIFQRDEIVVKVTHKRDKASGRRKGNKKSKQKSSPIHIEGEKVTLKKVEGVDYLEGTIRVYGVELNGIANLTVTKGEVNGSVQVKVAARSDNDSINAASGLKINLVDKDSESNPARWVSDNSLEIYAKHPMISRFIGPADQGWPYQETTFARVRIADIVAWATAKKILLNKARSTPIEYQGDDNPEINIDNVDTSLQEIKREIESKIFVEVISTSKLKRLLEEESKIEETEEGEE